MRFIASIICAGLLLITHVGADVSAVYEPPDGSDNAGHIVFLAGDEEYRSEEGLPMLAKILSRRHGFRCTVLFALDEDGTINPDNTRSLPGAEALDSADAIVMLIRFRDWPAEQMKHFADAYLRGVPIIALRTSTHAFRISGGPFENYNDFGKRVLGEQWVSHWGKHKAEATRGVIEPANAKHPILNAVRDIFGDSDVYEVYPPDDATILVRGQVLAGMRPDSPPADYGKKRASDGQAQPVNDPMMPIAWTREHRNEAGNTNRVFCTTMGAATDLQSEGLRRLIVNAVYWGLELDVPEEADVRYVGTYQPTMYGFGDYRKGVRPADHALPALSPAVSPSPGTPGEGRGEGRAPDGATLVLNKGDHIAFIGNALADRMQHHGWLETYIHARFPEHNLVVRNLAAAGDEIVIRHRANGFGSPDEWLTKTSADVIFAFFGFNESFRGEAGLPAFREDLDRFLKHTRSQNYSGRGPPRVVLFSPIAAERHRDENFRDPEPINANLALYIAAMRDVAAENDVPLIDLFAPSQAFYAAAAETGESLTINGLHLHEKVDRGLAAVIFEALFGEAPRDDEHHLAKLRSAVLEKNRQWHARYRTVDGYNIYGGRSNLSYPSDDGEITNRHVMQQEMSQRDVLTANRDKLVWATARGEEYVIDDSNLPPTTPVPTNKPGDGPHGHHAFLSGEQAIAKMTVHRGGRVNLFASEEMFPQLVNPVQMAWDTKGRLWVSAWRNYPGRTPTSTVGDSLLILEDTDGDGVADRCTEFLGDLNCPTGFQFYRDGVLVMQAPDLWFVRDTDGDNRADEIERVLMGMDSADSHHTANSMVLDPGGAVYLSDGVFHRTQVETALGPVRNNDGAIYRFEPRTGSFERYIAYNFANPHGRVFDYWGNDLVTDATGNHTYFAPAFSGRLDYPHKHPRMQEFWPRPARPSPGTAILTSRHFPDDFQGNFLNLNVIGFQGIFRVKVIEDGSGLRGERLEDLVSSSDPNFRPVAVNVGPDGAVYFADWHNPIIGHMQHHLRDPSRDHAHGRIYRLTYDGRPLASPPRIDGAPVEQLLELLKEPENQTRELAKIELGKHDSARVISALSRWIGSLDPREANHEHHLAEALWLHQWHNVVDLELLARMLESREPRARAAATRVLCYWRDRVPDALPLLMRRASDEHPRVRLEAIRAASFFRSPAAADVALAALKHPGDYYIDYALGETIRQLEPYWREALLAGEPVAGDNPAGQQYLLRRLTSADLLKLPRNEMTLAATLAGGDVTFADRHTALAALAELRGVDRATALLDVLQAAHEPAARETLVKLLPQLHPTELLPRREVLMALARAESESLRQYAWAAIVTADESFETAWPAAAEQSREALADLLAAVPLVYDPFIRARALANVMPMLSPEHAHDALRPAAIRAAASINREHAALFAALATLIERGRDVPTAAAAMRTLPPSALDAQRSGAVAAALVAWARRAPIDQRSEQEYLATVQLAETLIAALPADRAAPLLSELRELRVAAFVVAAVPEQMRFDTTRLVVEAGKPVQITLVNNDLMPHNLVVVAPRERPRIGQLAMTMKPDQLDSAGRAFVPADDAILAATKMIDPGTRETLSFTAPEAEGEYEYVCTYPDHWQVMWGTLIVTKDVDAYLRARP